MKIRGRARLSWSTVLSVASGLESVPFPCLIPIAVSDGAFLECHFCDSILADVARSLFSCTLGSRVGQTSRQPPNHAFSRYIANWQMQCFSVVRFNGLDGIASCTLGWFTTLHSSYSLCLTIRKYTLIGYLCRG